MPSFEVNSSSSLPYRSSKNLINLVMSSCHFFHIFRHSDIVLIPKPNFFAACKSARHERQLHERLHSASETLSNTFATRAIECARRRQNACRTFRTQKRNDYPKSPRPFLARTQSGYDEPPRKTAVICSPNMPFGVHIIPV